MGDFPQTLTSNMGRQVTVERGEDTFVFSVDGADVAEMTQPDRDAPSRSDGLVLWPLTFPAYPSTTVLGDPDEPPLRNALLYIDIALDDE